MASKLTITLDDANLYRVRALVAAGKARSVPEFIQHAVAIALDDVADWENLLANAL
ncbi:MAG TPA: hypothetical protein VGI64_11270 [Streptosporangiaceae bacterium]|jgi:hypothetical protein